MVEGLPQAAVPPSVEVALHRGPRRKIFGEHPPLAPAGRDEQNGIHDRAQIDRARPSARPCRRQKRRKDRPFPIRHVARITSANTGSAGLTMNSATFSASAPATTSMFPPIAADSSTSGGPRPCWPSCKPHDGTSPHVREHRLCLLARALTEPSVLPFLVRAS